MKYLEIFIFKVLSKLTSPFFVEKLGKSILKPLIKWKKHILEMFIVDDSFIKYVKRKREGLDMHNSEIKVLALRGSNADYGFYPSVIQGSYNLGLTSSDLYVTYQMYRNSLRILPVLETIILFYSVSACGLNLIRTTEKYRQVVYDFFFDIPFQEGITLNKKRVNRIKRMCARTEKNGVDISYWGYEKKEIFLNSTAEERTITHLRENRREPNQLEWLVKLSQDIYKDGRRLFIVISPFRSDYKRKLGPESDIFHKLYSLDLSPSTQILDFYDSPLFDDSDMGDTDHLNEKGAQKLTSEIARFLNRQNRNV